MDNTEIGEIQKRARKSQVPERERHTKSAAGDKDDHSSSHISKACCNFHLISPDDWCGG